MIVPMKKIAVVMPGTTRRESLKSLRRAGVVHVQRENGAGGAPAALTAEFQLFEDALGALPKSKAPKSSASSAPAVSGRRAAAEAAEAILDLRRRESEIIRTLGEYALQAETLKPWGNFEPADIRILAAKGIDIRLVEADAPLREEIAADNDAEFITLKGKPAKKKKAVLGAVIYRRAPSGGGIPGMVLPEYGLSELFSLSRDARAELADIRRRLAENISYRDALTAARDSAAQEIEFEQIRDSLGEGDGLAWFTGYLPAEEIQGFRQLAARECWGIMITDPAPDDEAVPTLVRNSPIIGIIRPIFDFLGIVPGYREAEISIWFLLFLSIFTGMILGDGAYGVIVLTAAAVIRVKTGKPSDLLRLITVFGFAALLWGAVTGTWFSSLSLVRDTPLRKLVIPAMATYQSELFPDYIGTMRLFPGDQFTSEDTVRWISLFLGTLMICIGRVQNFFRRLPSMAAPAQLGWLSIVLGLYWLIMALVLQLTPLPFLSNAVLPMIIGGLIIVFVFGGQEKGRSFGSGVLQGLKDMFSTTLDTIGAFGDILSFIRLFAVGLAGVSLARSFNEIAPSGGVGPLIAAALILTLGHGLNFVLNTLSVLVHGVRLNVMEFAGHLDIEWSGTEFDPFRLRVPESELPESHKE